MAESGLRNNLGTALIADETTRAEARRYKSELLVRMFGTSATSGNPMPRVEAMIAFNNNLVGVGYGTRNTSGIEQAELAVRVYVREKVAISGLLHRERIPRMVNGLPTDVIVGGDLSAHVRPTYCGMSIGHHRITAGTLGCLVKQHSQVSDDICILSNNHVLANATDSPTDGPIASRGDCILEPGPKDGGDPNDPIAHLEDWEALDFSGAPNHIDAAIARLRRAEDALPEIAHIGRVRPEALDVVLSAPVRKHGRTSLHTVGKIVDIAADVIIRYGDRAAQFVDQLAMTGADGLFSTQGDSGSLVIDADSMRPVGLLFAGGGNQSFANPIKLVLARFHASIL